MAGNDSNVKKPRRERGTGRIWRIGDTWYIQYYVNGRQVRETTRSTNENVAKKLLRTRIGEAAAGVHRELRRLKYEDLRRGFFDDYRTNKRKSLRWKKDGEPRLDPVTRLDRFFEGYRATSIDRDAMVDFTKKLQAEGKADSTINRSLAALRRMFHLAKKNKKIRDVPDFPMLSEEGRVRQGVLEHESYAPLLAALPEYLKPVLAIGYHTGMRLGEIQRLRWEQVDWMGRVFRLKAGETKNNAGRDVPISDELYRMLEAAYRERPAGCPFVCNRDGHPVGDFRMVWYDRCSKLGLGRLEKREKRRGKYRGLIFHDLRRTFVTDAEHAGAPRHEVMKGTGHKTESVYKRYAIANPEGQQAAMNKIVAYRSGEKTGKNDVPQTAAEAPESLLTH